MATDRVQAVVDQFGGQLTDENSPSIWDNLVDGFAMGFEMFYKVSKLKQETKLAMKKQQDDFELSMKEAQTAQDKVDEDKRQFDTGIVEDAIGRSAKRKEQEANLKFDREKLKEDARQANQTNTRLSQPRPAAADDDSKAKADQLKTLRTRERDIYNNLIKAGSSPDDPAVFEQASRLAALSVMSPQDQAAKAQELEDARLKEDSGKLRGLAARAVSNSPELLERLNILSEQSGGPVSFKDIYGGASTEDVLGPIGETPFDTKDTTDRIGFLNRADRATKRTRDRQKKTADQQKKTVEKFEKQPNK